MNEPVIRLAQGAVQGVQRPGCLQFYGIPYGQAPVAERRFLPPLPALPHSGVRDCTQPSPTPVQGPGALGAAIGRRPANTESEDCLTLTVSTPDPQGNRPVAVWFYGGANLVGGADQPLYDNASLSAAQDLVTVNVNYRIGPFGFLQHPAIDTHNRAVQDMLLALQWVQANIAAFGGDPTRVTVYGQSAGANNLLHLLALGDAKGLFDRVILQSPSLGRGNLTQADAVALAEGVLQGLGISAAAPDALPQLQQTPAAHILQAVADLPKDLTAPFAGMIFKTVSDAWADPCAAIDAALQNAAEWGITLIYGSCRDENYAFLSSLRYEAKQQAKAGQQAKYNLPGQYLCERAAAMGITLYRYYWVWGPGRRGAAHCIDLPMVFGNQALWPGNNLLKGASPDEQQRMCQTVQGLWGQLMRREPLGAQWPLYTAEAPFTKVLDNFTNPVVLGGLV